MVNIIDGNEEHIGTIVEIAEKTWLVTYASILSADQLQYMLQTIYSTTELKKVMQNGSQKFLILEDNNGFQGFASFGVRSENPSVSKLHKLYVLPHNQGKGYGKALIEEVKRRVLEKGIKSLDLNVNRYNPAKAFYEKLGFKIIREEDVPIGEYFMNDYVMRLTIAD